MGSSTIERESRVYENLSQPSVSRVPPDTWNPVGRRGDHPPSLNTTRWAIAKSTVMERWKGPREGSEKNLKLYAYKHIEHVKVWYGTFCRMVRRVIDTCKVKVWSTGAEGKPSLKRAKFERTGVCENRPETGWPIHGQVEAWVKSSGGPNPLPLKW